MTIIKADFLIIDAHAMAYRAYYALQGHNLTHPETGIPTHAIHGFFNIFFPLLLRYDPQNCIVTWDAPGHTFREKIFPDYKATRKPMPEDLRNQIEEIKALLRENGFCNIELTGFEADDLMGTLSKRFSQKEKKQVYLVTNDKDCFQLLDKNIVMLKSRKGSKEFIHVDSDWLQKEIGISPQQVTDYMGLVGDTSDNIPGVQGVGPRSALNLLEEYKTLENIYEHIASVSNKGLQKKLQENKEKAFLSRKLATIQTDIKEALELDNKKIQTPVFFNESSQKCFSQQGYTRVAQELKKIQNEKENIEGTNKINQIKKEVSYQLVTDLTQLKNAIKEIKKQMGQKKQLALDTETNSLDVMLAQIVGISLCATTKKAFYISLPSSETDTENMFKQTQKGIPWEKAHPILKDFLENKKLCIIGQNIKYDYAILKRWGIDLAPPYFDTMLASYLCDPSVRRHNLDDMAQDLLGYTTIRYEEIVGKGAKKKTLDEIEPEKVSDYACEDADISLRLYGILKNKIKKNKLERVYYEIEMPLLPVLLGMEEEGVAIDKKYFTQLSKEYIKKLDNIKEKIYQIAGYEFNIQSTRELQKLLFEKLNLPKGRKTKTGYSTDHDVLEKLQGLHPLVDNILEHRKCNKLFSTYIDSLPRLINPRTKRIHTSFSQTITATGRLSSINPNLQNIPIREEAGRAIRRGFIPHDKNTLVSLDYSQVELRIMAHYAEDETLLSALNNQETDIHKKTAASLFSVSEEEVTPDMRSHAKTVNFSIIYGITEFGLAKSLGVERYVASEYIQKFFLKYPGVRRYMDHLISFAEEKGYVETLSGRIRPIPNIKDSNHFRREGAQRMAINTPIQGSSADIIKVAMIDIDNDIRQKKWKSRMILQVHDELLFDVAPEEEKEFIPLAKKRMENAVSLRVPLFVDAGQGKNWDEAH